MTTRHLAAAIALLAVPTLSAAPGDVYVVRQNGTGDFTTLTAAMAAAKDGDIFLIGPGNYTLGGPVGDRSFAFVGEEGPYPKLGGSAQPLGIQHVPPTGSLLFSRLDLTWVEVEKAAGGVWFDDCRIYGPPSNGYCSGTTALTVRFSHDVAVVRSWVEGGKGGNDHGACEPYFVRGGSGLRLRGATCAAWRTFFRGGEGSPGWHLDFASSGGFGVNVLDALFLSYQNSITGGDGGDERIQSNCGSGGDALRGVHSPRAVERDTIFVPGEAGISSSWTCDDGQAVNLVGGTLQSLPYSSRALEAPRILTAGTAWTLDASKRPPSSALKPRFTLGPISSLCAREVDRCSSVA